MTRNTARPATFLLLAALVVSPGCSRIVDEYQAATATSAGADPIPATATTAEQAFRESLVLCDRYRRSLSATQRTGGSTLAVMAATSGALGLAFAPAGAATVAGFTAGSTILATASAQWSGTTYFGLGAQEISRRFNQYYTDPMNDLAKTSYTLSQVLALHSKCSLEYMAAQSGS